MENRNNTRVSEKFKIFNIKNIQTIVPKSLKSYSVTELDLLFYSRKNLCYQKVECVILYFQPHLYKIYI